MPLSWNEIKHRAIAFSKEWKEETREEAEAKSFWDAFFHVFGQQRRHVASYEEPVKKLSGDWGFIDLFWPKTLLTAPLATPVNYKRTRKAASPKPIPPGKSTPESEALAAHFYSAKEEPPPYRTD